MLNNFVYKFVVVTSDWKIFRLVIARNFSYVNHFSVSTGTMFLAATPVKVADVADPMPTVYMRKPSELPLYTSL